MFRGILSGCCVEKVLGSVSGPPGESIDWRHATPALDGLTGGRRASFACFWLDIQGYVFLKASPGYLG